MEKKQNPAPKKPPEEPFKKPLIATKFLLYGGAAIIFILFLTAVAMPVFSNPTFCGKVCHSQTPSYEAWQKSSHAQITCYACHVEPGLFNLFKDKLTAGPMGVYFEITGNYEKPINAESKLSQEHMENEVCERCHDVETRKFTYSRGLIMNHEPHLKAKLHCTTCHNRVAHLYITNYDKGEKKDHKYLNGMSMREGCFRCHSAQKPYTAPNGKKSPTACVTCHNKDAELPIGHGKGWRIAHGGVARQDFNYCFRCHEKEVSCERCHEKGIQFPPTVR